MAGKYSIKLTADTSQHNQALKQSAQQVYQYKKQVETAKQSLSNIVSTVGKFATSIGIAAGGVETFKKVITSTESGVDALGRAMNVAKTSTNQFFSSLTNGTGVQSFLRDLKDIKQAAIDAYNALDDLGTLKMWQNVKINKIMADIYEDRGIVNSSATSAQQKKAAQDRITTNIAILKSLNDELIEETENTYYTALRNVFGGYMSNSNIDAFMKMREEGKLEQYISNYDKKHKIVPSSTINGSSITGYVSTTPTYTYDSETNHKFIDMVKKFAGTTDAELQEILNLQNEISTIRMSVAQQSMRAEKAANKNIGGTSSGNESVKEELTLLQQLQQQLKELEKQREMLYTINDDGDVIWDADQLADINTKILDITNSIEKLNREINPNTNFNISSSGLLATPDDYEKAMQVIEQAQADAMKVIDESSANIYANIKSVSGAMNELINVYDSWRNLTKNPNADFIDYFQSITSSVFATIDAITTVAKAVETISAIIESVKAAQALTDAVVAKAELAEMAAKVVNFYAPMGALGIAPAASTIAAYQSLAKVGAFADGGIVGGGTTVGDRVIARLNAGEMVLNQSQQSQLFRALNGVGFNSNNTANGNVHFKISGNDLVGVLNNYNNKQNRVR